MTAGQIAKAWMTRRVPITRSPPATSRLLIVPAMRWESWTPTWAPINTATPNTSVR
jgi:hypothetical protein